MGKQRTASMCRSWRISMGLAAVIALAGVLPLKAAERNIMLPRVPADQLSAARALKSPILSLPEIAAKGKALYEGKGTCVNCHGATGRGDGVAAAVLDPSPRNFHHHGFWRHRTEGEVFWVIKNGSAGTGMLPLGGLLTDEEIWTVIQYERSFSGGRGPMGGMGPGGMGGMGGGMGPREGECCARPEGQP
jgi:mono/diheme cytochrome c family protein